MRILIYGLNFSPEKVGIGKYTGEMFDWLQENNHSCDVITAQPFFPNWESEKKFYSFNKNIIRCPLWVPKNPSGFKRILHLSSFILTSFPIVFVSCLKKYDLIINAVNHDIFQDKILKIKKKKLNYIKLFKY